MVHALNEIHRALAPGGILIDLRPMIDQSPVEVISEGKTRLAGVVNQLSEDIANDEAANNAIAKAAEQSWFSLERLEHFSFSYVWDSPEEMQDYIEEEWADFVSLDDAVWQDLRSLWAVADTDAQLQIQVKMMIARWKVMKGD